MIADTQTVGGNGLLEGQELVFVLGFQKQMNQGGNLVTI